MWDHFILISKGLLTQMKNSDNYIVQSENIDES